MGVKIKATVDSKLNDSPVLGSNLLVRTHSRLVIVLTKAAPTFFYKAEFIKWLLRFIFSKSVVFPAQAEYSYFTADFRLKIFLYGLRHFRFRIFWGINYKCLVSRSVRI